MRRVRDPVPNRCRAVADGPNGVTWMTIPGAETRNRATTAIELAVRARRNSASPAAATATSHASPPIVLSTVMTPLSL